MDTTVEHLHGPEATPHARKLLIVDDEEKICRMLATHFSLRGYEVRTVLRGNEGVAIAHVFHPDVVLLDLLMPDMTGVETLKALKQLSPAPKVLILSAANDEQVARGALALGADFYVCKPPQLSELDHVLNGFLPPTTRH